MHTPTAPPPPTTANDAPPPAPLWKNVITLFGAGLAFVALLFLVIFFLLGLAIDVHNPYLDAGVYLALPTLLLIGMVLMPAGVLLRRWWQRHRRPGGKTGARFPTIDLNDPIHRRIAKYLVGGTLILIPVAAVASYKGYHYSDSSAFCGQTCHQVMEPQFTTYEVSAHARVQCAECHIGAGADWFVKSKLSGLRQVAAVMLDTYPRPIPPAITELRPARDTCEECHWPAKFYGANLVELNHFGFDEQNSPAQVRMLLKIGGGDETTGRAEGIHWHMAITNVIEYVATDDLLQDIPWVKFTDGTTGRTHVFRSDGKPTSDPIPEGVFRRLDCMDCHNRPAHKFLSPVQAMDVALDVGRVDRTLPFIKREGVRLLAKDYPDRETIERTIGAELTAFYQKQYPDVWEQRRASVNQAVDVLRDISRRTIFPAMNVDWRTYPDNIGHKIVKGCFRCHDGRHVNEQGTPISTDCHTCHTFQTPTDKNDPSMIREGEFIHPLPLEGVHQRLLCSQCHDGGMAKPRTCDGCHAETTALRTGQGELLARFGVSASAMADLECEACHDLSEPRSPAAIDQRCTDCHDPADDERFNGMLTRWTESTQTASQAASAAVAELRAAVDRAPKGTDQSGRIRWLESNGPVLDLLKKAGPLHNYEAAIRLYERITKEAHQLLETGRLADSSQPTTAEGT